MGVVIPIIGIGLTAIGAAIKAKGEMEMAEYQAGVSEQSAKIMRENARAAIVRGESVATLATIQGGRVIGKQRAAASTSGVDVASESIVDALSSTRFFNRLDVSNIRYNAQMEGRGYEVQATDYLARAELARMKGKYAALGTLIGGGANVLSMGYSSDLFPKFTS